MEKRGRVSLYGIFVTILVAVAITHTSLNFILSDRNSPQGPSTLISGLAVENNSNPESQIVQVPQQQNNSKTSQMIIIIEWAVLIIVIILGFAMERMHHKKESQNFIELHIPEREKGKTDLDLLYDLLKEKKKIKIWAIAKLFKVSEDIVLEWARILEAGNLAILNYPKFGEAELVIINNIQEKK